MNRGNATPKRDLAANQKMVDTHQKLMALMRKVKTMIQLQNRQLRIDSEMEDIRRRFIEGILQESTLEGGTLDLDMVEIYGRFLPLLLPWN